MSLVNTCQHESGIVVPKFQKIKLNLREISRKQTNKKRQHWAIARSEENWHWLHIGSGSRVSKWGSQMHSSRPIMKNSLEMQIHCILCVQTSSQAHSWGHWLTPRHRAAALTRKHPELPFTSQTTLVVTLIVTVCLQTVPLVHWQETVRLSCWDAVWLEA